MPSPDESKTPSDPDILAARGKVELAKAELESRLYQAGDTGKRAISRMARKATPFVVVAGGVLGAVVLFRLVTRARHKSAWRAPRADRHGPSLVQVALGAAFRAALRVVAARIAEQAAARLATASDEHAPEPEASVPSPS
jgi:hypothetical protein